MPNLHSLSLAELKQLQKSIAKAMANFERRGRAEARTALEEKAKELGYSLSVLTGISAARRTTAPTPAKYRHPIDPGTTWSGRGRRPLWFQAALDSGKSPKSMTI